MPGDAKEVLLQAGCVPVRRCGDMLEVMLVTSRYTGQWIVPKGTIDPGEAAAEAARREAEEEAGVRGRVGVVVGLEVGVAVRVGVLVALDVGVAVVLGVAIAEGVGLAVSAEVGETESVGVRVGVGVEVPVGVLVTLGVEVAVAVSVGVGIADPVYRRMYNPPFPAAT